MNVMKSYQKSVLVAMGEFFAEKTFSGNFMLKLCTVSGQENFMHILVKHQSIELLLGIPLYPCVFQNEIYN